MKGSVSRVRRMLPAFVMLLLAGCGGKSSSGGDSTEAPLATVSSNGALGVHDNIVVTFKDAMNPSSLSFGDGLGAMSDGGTWSDGNRVLTLAPGAAGAWESGNQPLTMNLEDVSVGQAVSVQMTVGINFTLSNFQSASTVVGQANFTDTGANQGASAAAETLNLPYGRASIVDNILWIPDYGNNRMLGFDGFPSANDASAGYVVGQTDFVSTSSGAKVEDSNVSGPQGLLTYNGLYYLVDNLNNRVLIFNSAPYAAPRKAVAVLGQPDLKSNVRECSAKGLNFPETMIIANGKLLVADGNNNRILIWNKVPTATGTEPDLVLGQAKFNYCMDNDDNQDGIRDDTPSARTLSLPAGVWTDGTRLVVADDGNNRVLIWKSFPTKSFQPADIVLGQADFTHNTRNDDNQDGKADTAPSARTLHDPYEGVWSNGRQLFVSDGGNNRLLIWNRFPTANFQAADAVIGQSDFTHSAGNDDNQDGKADATASARTMHYPGGMVLQRDNLLIFDALNNRALVFKSS